MDKSFLNCEVEQYYCPFCKEPHMIRPPIKLIDYTRNNPLKLCRRYETEIQLYFDGKYCYMAITKLPCKQKQEIYWDKIPIEEICTEDTGYICIYLKKKFVEKIMQNFCAYCCDMQKERCYIQYLKEDLPLNFKLSESTLNTIEERQKMEKTTFALTDLYNKSPKENLGQFYKVIDSHKDTLKWVFPVAAIWAAWKILKKMNADPSTLATESKNKLGVVLDGLDNKRLLKDLMFYGSLIATGGIAINLLKNKNQELSIEALEEGINSIEKKRDKFKFLQPKIETLFPIAISVIIFALMTQKPAWFENIKNTVKGTTGNLWEAIQRWIEIPKLYIADKLNIDLSDEQTIKKFKKFVLLAAVMVCIVFLYAKGKNVSQIDEKLKKVTGQIINLMKKIMPTVFAGICTYLIAKGILRKNDKGEMEFSDEETLIDEFLPEEIFTKEDEKDDNPEEKKETKNIEEESKEEEKDKE